MTPTISSNSGALPTATSSCSTPAPAPYTGPGTAPMTTAVAPAAGNGAVQAVNGVAAIQGVQGAQATQPNAAQPVTTQPVTAGGGVAPTFVPGTTATPEQLVPILQDLVSALNQLIPILQSQVAGASGGGGAAGAGCTMPDCPMRDSMQGAMGAPTAPAAAAQAVHGASARPTSGGGGGGADTSPAAGNVDPSTVKDKTSTDGLTGSAMRGLEVAHTFGLPLVSGHRSGGSSNSDHPHGRAIDVSTIPIGAASSTEGTPQMKAYAEHMRLAGKRGELDVKYVILDGRIASSRDNWEWRPYTYPGKTAAELESLKSSNRGEYNRIQHYDHVHVSFNG